MLARIEYYHIILVKAPLIVAAQYFLSEKGQQIRTMSVTCVYRTIRRLRDTGSIQDRPRSGRPRTCRTKERIKRVREKIRRNPQRSATKLALKERIDDRSMRRIL